MTQTPDPLTQVLDLAATRFGVDRDGLKPDADLFSTLGVDSYQALELLTELESHFGVEVPDYEVQGVRTFAELAAVLAARL